MDAAGIDNVVLVPGGGTADIFAASARPGAVSAGGAGAFVITGAVVAPGSAPCVIADIAIDATFGFAMKPPTDRAGGSAGGAMLDPSGPFQFANPSSQVLVQADPGFGDYHTSLSSDCFLDELGDDPSRVHRRLGDGLHAAQAQPRRSRCRAVISTDDGAGSPVAAADSLCDRHQASTTLRPPSSKRVVKSVDRAYWQST